MKIVLLDTDTLGEGLETSFSLLSDLGSVEQYAATPPQLVEERICDCDIVIVNKIRLCPQNLAKAKHLKLICLFATGYDNVDTEYCRERKIALCNVKGYSTMSVAQLTAAFALSLTCHLSEYREFVRSGEYTKAGLPNRLKPSFHEIYGKTWGIIGYGAIGRAVGEIARALGCNILINKRVPDGENCVDIETLLQNSDLVSLHIPLNEATRNLISRDRIDMMKTGAMLINTARGAVTDESAVADALLSGKLGAFASDVYSTEPIGPEHPFNKIMSLPNVCLTPHMAWAAEEARQRCFSEVILNIKAFLSGENRNRIV